MNGSHIVLIACGKRKAPQRRPARDLYQGALFQKSSRYAESLNPDAIRILSAKHHVIEPSREIAPYDLTLNPMPAAEVRRWAETVLDQLQKEFDLTRDRFTFLAGKKYRRYLEPKLRHTEVPMEGLPIGKQLQFLGKHAE